MATVNLGNIKFNWKGAYNNSTAYVVDDVVSSSGSSYICILASTGNAPTNTTYWQQMSAAGANGTNGTDLTTTLTTQGDLVYRDGSGLQRLGAGTAGQVLQTGGSGANPSWGTVSSDFVKLQSYTNLSASGGNYLTFDFSSLFTSTYEHYKLIIDGMHLPNASGYQLRARLNVSGTTQTGSHYRTVASYVDNYSGGGAHSAHGRWDNDYITITWLEDSTPQNDTAVIIDFLDPLQTTSRAKFYWNAQGMDNNYLYRLDGWGLYNGLNGAIQGMSFYGDGSQAVNFRKAELYGIK